MMTNPWPATLPGGVFKFALDDRSPWFHFLPCSIMPGLPGRVCLPLDVFDRRTGRAIDRHAAAIVLAMILSALVFIVYPTMCPRPD
jgi:hypothetical protein